MTDYLPTTDEVRGSLVFLNKHYAEQRADVDVDLLVVESETAAQFDRMIAEVERAAAEKAWDEGRESVAHDLMQPAQSDGTKPASVNPYRAAEIRGAALAPVTEEGDKE